MAQTAHNKPLRIIFGGTPDFAAAHLSALIDSKHEIIGVYTQPDRPAGRGRTLKPSAVKELALKHQIDIYQPQSLKDSSQWQQMSNLQPDLVIVVAYGLILPKEILAIPKYGCINVHASILPRWRGAAPIQRAIEAGDSETGISIMQMDTGLDTGDILCTSKLSIEPTDTSQSLFQKFMQLGPNTLLTSLDDLSNSTLHPTKQDNQLATYAHKLSKDEALVNWCQSATVIDRKIRANTPWPGNSIRLNEQTLKMNGKIYIPAVDDSSIDGPAVFPSSKEHDINQPAGTILDIQKDGLVIACDEGYLLITALQYPGKKMQAIAQHINNHPDHFQIGMVLT